MFRLILVCVFIHLGSVAFSQSPAIYKNRIKVSPVRAFNAMNPGLELGYERDFGKHFSTQLSAAWLNDFFNTTPYENYNGYRFLIEEKFHHFNSKYFRFFFGIETGFYSASMISSAWFVPLGIEMDDIDYYELQYADSFNLDRTGFMIAAKYGVRFFVKHLTMEYSIGIGAIFHDITHSNRTNPDDPMVQPRHPNIYYMMESEGNHAMPNFPWSFKIGYAF